MRLFRLAVLGPACLAAAASAAITADNATDVRKTRYREMGAAFKTISDQLKTGTLIRVTLKSSARLIATAARDQYAWYPAGSGPQAQPKTKALPAIWSDAAGFRKAQDNFQRQAALMAQVAEQGDLPAISVQARALGETCGGCHRTYRLKD
ncbi:c-type cytochrome [Novosphingobium bradum]|uniref:C-type cytochrome n=1 Tax=Novosphingobium bradum TaxID=1737444 RepID=A0ABV7IN56_9SPHN